MVVASKWMTLSAMTVLCLTLFALWQFLPHPAVIVVLCFLPFALLFVLRFSFWLVMFFVLFSFFRIHEALPALYSLKIPLLLSLGALSALLWHAIITRKLEMYWHPAFTWLSVFWALVIFGAVTSSNPGIAIEYIKNIYWKIIIMTFAVAWLLDNEEAVKHFSIWIVIAGTLIAIVAISNSLSGVGLVEGTRVTIGRHLGSVLGDPNDLSLVLMFPLAFAVSLATAKEIGPLRYLAFGAMLLTMWAVIATQSRGGLLGSLAVFGIFGLKMIRSKTLLITLGVVAMLVLFTLAGVSDRQSGGAAEEGIDASAMGRLYAWEAAFKMALDNPLTGVGLNNFFPNYFFYSSHWDGVNHAVHSTWFGVLAETGFLGLIVFCGIIVKLILTSRSALAILDKPECDCSTYLRATTFATYAGLVGTIVSGTFLTQGFTWPLYILASICIATAKLSQNYSQIENTAKEQT